MYFTHLPRDLRVLSDHRERRADVELHGPHGEQEHPNYQQTCTSHVQYIHRVYLALENKIDEQVYFIDPCILNQYVLRCR